MIKWKNSLIGRCLIVKAAGCDRSWESRSIDGSAARKSNVCASRLREDTYLYADVKNHQLNKFTYLFSSSYNLGLS